MSGQISRKTSEGDRHVAVDSNREIEDILLRALSYGNEFAALIDNRAKICWANNALAKKHDLEPENLIGSQFNKLLDSNLSDLAQEILITAINEGLFFGELLMSSSDRSFTAQVAVSYVPPSKHGDDFHILFLAHDRSAIQPLEEEARKRRGFLSTIIRRAPLGIFCLDTKGEITIINDSMLDMSSRAGIILKTGDSIFNSGEKLNPVLMTVIEAGLKGTQTDFGDSPLLSEPHTRLMVSIMGTPIVSPEGNLEGVMIILEDRTEKFRIAEKLREADRLASLGVLAANIAHEVNNPLTGIMAILQILRDESIAKGIEDEPFERISSNLDRIKNIVRGLLDFSRKKISVIRNFEINDVVERTVSFFRMQPRFKWIPIECILNEVPTIKGDTGQIEQVLQDLILNAAQAIGEEGKIIISTGYDNSSREVLIKIKDNGSGISPENLDKIFEPFFTTKDTYQGTGLGLAVSRTLVNQHGGTLYVEETSLKGSTFVIRLPISKDVD